MHNKIKTLFSSSVEHVVSRISDYSINPETDFQRSRKINPSTLISFLVSQGSSSTKVEMLDFWGVNTSCPTSSALNQQRAKLKASALEAVFQHFNASVRTLATDITNRSNYRLLAADGSTCTYFSTPKFSPDEYYYSPGHSIKGVYSMHLNAFYDLETHTYTDALIQSVHEKNEFRAFCDIVDRHDIIDGRKNVYIGDRGYCSYNNMAHVIEQKQYFLFRSKDIHSKGLVAKFDFPPQESFDIDVNVALVRSLAKKVVISANSYRRFVNQDATFDYLEYGSYDTYELSFRVVRFPISDTAYECIVTNLPSADFPLEQVKSVYYSRWGIESSFRKLKYTIGLSNFHSYKTEYIQQEIWAKLITYNISETLINHTILEKHDTKHAYKVNFTIAAHICRVFLRLTTEKNRYNVMFLLQREVIPIREERKFPRLQTAHFRKPRYFIYRAA